MVGALLALVFIVGGILLFVAYFLPSAIAIFRNHRNLLAIILINVFLGWSIIGWVIALVWAVYREPDRAGAVA